MADGGKQKAGGRKGCLGALAMGLLILAALALLAAAVYLHTEDGRQSFEARAEKWLGMDLAVEEVSLGWPGCVVLRGIESDPPSPGAQPLFQARELRVGLSPGLRWRMELRRPVLTLVRNSDGSWAPGALGRIGELPRMKMADLGPLTEDLREDVDLHVSEGEVHWLDEDGKESVGATGVDFRMAPVDLPGRRMYYYFLTAHTLLRRDGARAYDVRREWLSSVEQGYVELHNSEASGSPKQDFW
jgi:hypothetical protein